MRVQIELNPKAIDFLDNLKKKLGLATRVETIKYALSLLNWAVKEAEFGREIGTIDNKNKIVRVFVMPGLDILIENAQKN